MCSSAFMMHGPLPHMHRFQPKNFFGGQSAGRRGPILGHSDLPWGYPTRPWYCFTTKRSGLFCPSLQGGVRYAQPPAKGNGPA